MQCQATVRFSCCFPDLFRSEPLLICHSVPCSRIRRCGRRVREAGQRGVKPLALRMQRKGIPVHFQKASAPCSLAWAVVGMFNAGCWALPALQWGHGLGRGAVLFVWARGNSLDLPTALFSPCVFIQNICTPGKKGEQGHAFFEPLYL